MIEGKLLLSWGSFLKIQKNSLSYGEFLNVCPIFLIFKIDLKMHVLLLVVSN